MLKNKITLLRKKKLGGVPKSTVAKNIGCDRSHITRIEHGTAKPSLELAFEIARYFRCNIEDVFEYCRDKDRNY